MKKSWLVLVFIFFTITQTEAVIPQIEGGTGHAILLDSEGTVWTFGRNYYGQLGVGTSGVDNDASLPTQIPSLSNVIQISAGEYHSMALLSDGTVWTWGQNTYGQLGDGTTIHRSTPIQVSGLSNIIQISAGAHHSVALKHDGTLWSWGLNNNGQLGTGNKVESIVPIQAIISDITSVSCADARTFVIKTDRTVWGWGHNRENGYVGIGQDTDNVYIPEQLPNLSNITKIDAGTIHGLALKEDGTVWSWGANEYGQLGFGSKINESNEIGINNLTPIVSLTPQKIPTLTHIQDIATNGNQSLALHSNGTLLSWGRDYYGSAGTGESPLSSSKIIVTPANVIDLNNIIAIGTGTVFSFAIDNEHKVYSWGDNAYGRLGDGNNSSNDSRSFPYQILPSIGPPPEDPSVDDQISIPPVETTKPEGAFMLNIDHFTNNQLIADQFQAQGILIRGVEYPNVRLDNHGVNYYGHFEVDFIKVLTGRITDGSNDPMRILLVNPNNPLEKWVTNFFETKALDIEQLGTSPRLEAYDSNGDLLGSITGIDNGSGGPHAQTLTLEFEGMHEIRFYPERHPDDNTLFSFNGWYDIYIGEVYQSLREIAVDLNEDNAINSDDLDELANIVASRSAQNSDADLNGDGQVNSLDLMLMVRALSGDN